MLLSVVLPCFNEELVIRETYHRLVAALNELESDYELIFVDDGSQDRTLKILKELQASNSRVKVLGLSRNYGHQMAITAGIEHSSGDAVVILDADLQDPPEVIKEMVALWQQGYEVVYGQRTEREGEPPFRLWSAKWFSRMINKIADIDIPRDVGDFRLIDRKVAAALNSMPERDRFVRGMVSWIGLRQVAVPYRREARFAGVSKYSWQKMLRLATDGIFSFSLVPIKAVAALGGLITALAALGLGIALFFRLATGAWFSGASFLALGLFFLGGLQIFCLGVVGDYVGRTYLESKRRPLYLVQERLGFENPAQARGLADIAR